MLSPRIARENQQIRQYSQQSTVYPEYYIEALVNQIKIFLIRYREESSFHRYVSVYLQRMYPERPSSVQIMSQSMISRLSASHMCQNSMIDGDDTAVWAGGEYH